MTLLFLSEIISLSIFASSLNDAN